VTALAKLSTHLHPEQHSFRRKSRSRSPSVTRGGQSPTQVRGRSPTPIGRSTSPQDHGFAEAVSDLVDIVKYETSRKGRARAKLRGDEWVGSPTLGRSPSRHGSGSRKKRHRPWRGPVEQQRSRSASPECRSPGLVLDSRSRSPSPHPVEGTQSEYYGTTQLEQRSRSPSPSSAHSVPVQKSRLSGRSGKRRLLPTTPNKPSFLRLTVQSVENINFPLVSHSPTIPNRSPGNINFPKLNASPTHYTKQQTRPWNTRMALPGNGFSTLLAPLRAMGRANSSGCLAGKHSRGVSRELPQPPVIAPSPQMPYISGATAAPTTLQTWKEEPLTSYESTNTSVLAVIPAACDNRSRLLPSPMPNGYKPAKDQRRDQMQTTNATASMKGGQRPNSSIRTIPPTGQDTEDDDDEDWC
jgi:hypothetical protein